MTNKAASSSDPRKSGGIAFLATESAFVGIATLLVLTRVYVRTMVVKNFGPDDAVIVLALVSTFFVHIHRWLIEIRFSPSPSVV